MPATHHRALAAVTALFAVATIAGLALAGARPHLTGTARAWTGDELAFGVTWLVVAVCTLWLALTTLACLIALARGELGAAARIAACAPPLTRRLLSTALFGAVVLAPTAAAATTPSAPYTLHVGTSGRVTAPPTTSPAVPEVPVVRAPLPSATTTTPTTSTSTTTSTTVPPTTTTPSTTTRPAVAPAPRRAPAAAAASRAPATGASRRYVVRAGDNLWSIAAREVARRQHAPATDTQTADYWLRVVAANRTTLRSGDPSLIFPDEIVTLPLD